MAATSVSSVSSAAGARLHDRAVAQDGDGVGEREDLAQQVGDKDDGAPAGREAADDLVEPLGLGRREGGRRLVEDDQLGVAGQRPQDLDLLLLRQRERPDDRVRGDRETGVGHQALELLEQRAPPHEAEPARLLAQEHVLGDGALGDDRHLLGDERDAALQRLARRPEGDRLAAQRRARPDRAGRPRPRSCRAWTCRPRSRRRRRERSRRGSRSRRCRAPWCRRTTCRPRGCRGGRRPGP